MPFNENFWVTVGTAAPVIALAVVVSIADAFRVRERTWQAVGEILQRVRLDTTGRDVSWEGARDLGTLIGRYKTWTRLSIGAGLVNGVFQLIALWAALVSLEDGKNAVSPKLPEVIVPLGILLLLLAAIATLAARRAIQRIPYLNVLEKEPSGKDALARDPDPAPESAAE